MKTSNIIYGEYISLIPCTSDLWHEIYRKYIPDPMMDTTPFIYNYERCEKHYNDKTADITRQYFAVVYHAEAIGLIYLKHIDMEKKTTEFGITLTDDSVKGKGFGTEAIVLLVNYVFQVLNFNAIFADSVLQNTRSQYIMEKLGFVNTHRDDTFMYYKLEKDRYSTTR